MPPGIGYGRRARRVFGDTVSLPGTVPFQRGPLEPGGGRGEALDTRRTPQIFEPAAPRSRRAPATPPDFRIGPDVAGDYEEAMARAPTRRGGPLPAPAGAAPPTTRSRIFGALEGAGQAPSTQAMIGSESDLESFMGSALSTFSTVRGFGREMSAQQAEAERQATESRDTSRLRNAQAGYYERLAGQGATRGGLTLEERLELERARHEGDIEEIRERNRGASERARIISGRPRAGSTPKPGDLTEAEAAVFQRYNQAIARGDAAERALREERARSGVPDPSAPTGFRFDVTPDEATRARVGARGSDFPADSAYVADVINPKLYQGQPRRPAGPAPAPGRRAPNLFAPPPGTTARPQALDEFLGGPTPSAPAPAARPRSESQAGSPPEDEGVLSAEELEDALGAIEGLEEEEARDTLLEAGYTAAQIELILGER